MNCSPAFYREQFSFLNIFLRFLFLKQYTWFAAGVTPKVSEPFSSVTVRVPEQDGILARASTINPFPGPGHLAAWDCSIGFLLCFTWDAGKSLSAFLFVLEEDPEVLETVDRHCPCHTSRGSLSPCHGDAPAWPQPLLCQCH